MVHVSSQSRALFLTHNMAIHLSYLEKTFVDFDNWQLECVLTRTLKYSTATAVLVPPTITISDHVQLPWQNERKMEELRNVRLWGVRIQYKLGLMRSWKSKASGSCLLFILRSMVKPYPICIWILGYCLLLPSTQVIPITIHQQQVRQHI